MSGHRQSPTGAAFDFLFLKPVPAIIWILLLGFTGVIGYNFMVKESLPDLEIPEAYVITRWEGATPAMVEKEITQKIEKELRGMKGLKKIHSASKEEVSIVAVSFRAECSVSESLQLLNRQVSIARGFLPKGAERPKVEASSVRDIPIVSVALSGDVDRSVLEEQAEILKRRLERIPGIRRVNKIGARKEIVLVQLQPQRLQAYGIPATRVRQAVMSHGADAPWGKFENRDMTFAMRMGGAYREKEDLENLILRRQSEGTVLRLRDVARVTRTHLREKTRAALSWQGGEFIPVVAMDILKSPGQDTIALVKSVRNMLERAATSPLWPEGVQWRFSGDQSEAIWTELARGFNNGWQSMLVVFLVLFALLSWREALVAAVSVPLTLFGSIAVLWAMGYTFNLLVIVGMILALGLLVDDFILIMEGMHEGVFIKRLGFVGAVRNTIRTYAVPSMAGSVTTILVFLPLAFVGGVDGKFIRVIPVTAAVCLVMSYIVSVVLGPSMARPFLAREDKTFEPGWVDRLSHRVEKGLSAWMEHRVVGSRGQAARWVAGALFLFLVSLVAAVNLRDTLYPKEDGRTLGVTVELAADSTLDETAAVADRVGEILRGKPYFEHVMRVVGGKDAYSLSSVHDLIGRNRAPSMVGFACFFIPGRDRDKLAFEYVEPLRAELSKALENTPGARIFLNPQIGGSSGEDAVQIDIAGRDMTELRIIAREVARRLSRVPGVVDVRDNMGPEGTELRFRPMHEAMDYYGVSQEELAGQMVAYMEHEKVGRMRRSEGRDDLDIRLGTWWASQQGRLAGPKGWDELELLSIINEKGRAVPLWSLAEPEMAAAQQVILHKEGRRSVTVLAKLDGAYVSEVFNRMRPQMDAMMQDWPADYTYTFAGEKEVANTYENMFRVFLVAIVLVYCILALLFDSLLHPGIIMSTVLFALVGVFCGFFLLEIPFSFSASIGIVALVGIVVNDAIIVVQTMNNHRKAGLDVAEAARQGAADRLRPIFSTTVTNFAGLTPLALSDPGWAPLCKAIIFGEVTATLGAVVLIPALYVLLTPARKEQAA